MNELWYTHEMNPGIVQPVQLPGLLWTGGASGDKIGVQILRNRVPSDELDGKTVTGFWIRPDKQTVAISGTAASKTVYVVLPQEAYAYEGQCQLVIRVTSGGVKIPVFAGYVTIGLTSTSEVVDPGDLVPDLEDLLAAIDDMEEATDAAQAVADEYADTVGDLTERMTVAEDAIGAVVSSTVNLYNSGTRTISARVSGTTGNVGASGSSLSYDTSDFIPVSASTEYTAKRWGSTAFTAQEMDNYAFYKSDKTYSSGGSFPSTGVITSPADGAYLRISIKKSSTPTAPLTTVVAKSTEFPETYVPCWEITDELARQAFVASDSRFNGYIHQLGYTSLLQCTQPGWYGCSYSYRTSLDDLPADYDGKANSSGFTLTVEAPAAASSSAVVQTFKSLSGYVWVRSIVNGAVSYDWKRLDTAETMTGDVIAIIGDSISTNGNDGPRPNAVEITVETEDVGVQLSAYLTYSDVQGGLSLGGHTFTSDEIGTEVTFTPTADDVGKKIGLPINQYAASMQVWWEYASIGDGGLGFTTIPACYGGASMSSHEDSNSRYKSTYAWHDSQIRKCGIRTPGTMTRTAPTKIIIFRGVNDFSHSPYSKLTDGYFSGADWSYPTSDAVTGGKGYLEALALTIKKLRAAYPSARIYLCTLPAFLRLNVTGFPMTNGENSLPEYNAAILRASEFFGCSVIRFDLCWSIENAVSGGYVDSTDKTHPTSKGQKAMGIQAVKDLLK